MSLFNGDGLVYIPSSSKIGKLHSILPINGDGDLLYTNSSVRTNVNKLGALSMIPAETPRVVFKDGKPRLFMEPAGINIQKYPISIGCRWFNFINAKVLADAATAGENQFIDGNFDTPINWGLGEGWSISGGKAHCAYGSSHIFHACNFIQDGKIYQITFTIENYVSGSLYVFLGGYGISHLFSGNGNYTFYFNFHSDPYKLVFFSSNSFIGSVDNVSIREVQGFLDPLCTRRALKLNERTPNNYHKHNFNNLAVDNNTVYTFSRYFKSGERGIIYFNESNFNQNSFFNLITGNCGSKGTNHLTTRMELINGYFRCSVTLRTNATSIRYAWGISIGNEITNYIGEENSGVYMFGDQVEANINNSSFIYDGTEGAQKSRLQDVITLGELRSKNITGIITWSIYVDLYSITPPAENKTILKFRKDLEDQVTFEAQSTGKLVLKDAVNAAYPYAEDGILGQGKMCATYDGTSLRLFVNGVKVGPDYIPDQTFNEIDNMEWSGGTIYLTNALAILPICLSETEAISLTTTIVQPP